MTELALTDDSSTFEERADQLTDNELLAGTIVADHFDEVQAALIARGLVLIVGPRGCGKTHMGRGDRKDEPISYSPSGKCETKERSFGFSNSIL